MKRKIKLLKLLSWYKELQEERSKVRVYHALLNLQKLMEEKKLIEEEYMDCINYLEKEKTFSGGEVKEWLYYLNTLLEFSQIADNKIKIQKEHLELLKEELKRRNQEKRLMEKLMKKTQGHFHIEEMKKELKEIDEITLLRKGRELA
ncbi:MAG: hypothetical protein ACK4GE_01775 [Caldimicrobium sp.]